MFDDDNEAAAWPLSGKISMARATANKAWFKPSMKRAWVRK
jgi:hypothetical protein